jgi:hypothetical protein
VIMKSEETSVMKNEESGIKYCKQEIVEAKMPNSLCNDN